MWDEEVEKAMLYYLIFEHEEYSLDETDFVGDRNKKIIIAINQLKAEKQEISMLSIKSKIKANSKEVLEYISTLNTYAYGSSVEAIYKQIIEMSKKRKILDVLRSSYDDLQNDEDIDVLGQKIIQRINEIEKIGSDEKTFLQKVVEATEKIEKNTLEKTDYSLYTRINRFR